jgi:hypothetical protein
MTDDESVVESPANPLALPPLRIHHIMLATVTAAVLLSFHEVLRQRDVAGFSMFFRSGHGIVYTIVTALSFTLTLLGVWWRRHGIPFFHQPGHWLLVSNSLSIGVFLFAAVAAAGRWDARQMPYSLLLVYYVVMSLLSFAVNFWAAIRVADTFWWRALFGVAGCMALFVLVVVFLNFYLVYQFLYWLVGIATTILLSSAIISDRRARRARDWAHWWGAGLELFLSVVAIGQLLWQSL